MSAQELNRNPGGRLGCLQERVEAAWGFWWGAGGQAQVRENLDDHGGIFNGGEKRQGTAALGTGGDVDREDPFEQLRPTPAGSCGGRGGLAGFIGGDRGLVGLAGNDLGTQRRVGCEHAMEANEMEPRTWDERGQALQEFQRAHHQMGGAIAGRGFELQHDLAGWGAAQAFVPQGRARNVAAQTFEGVPLLGATARIGMQAKPLGTHTTLGLRCLLAGMAQRWIFPR